MAGTAPALVDLLTCQMVNQTRVSPARVDVGDGAPIAMSFAIEEWPIVDTSIGVGHFALPVADCVLKLARVLRAGGVTVSAGAVLAIAADTLCGGLVGSRCQQNV